jgi:hypothetical protein
VSAPVTDLNLVEDGQDLAVVLQGGTIERWQWRDGVMQKDGHRLPPFFFTGLITEGKVMPGNFTPPVRGEWFQRMAADTTLYLVVKVETERTFRCGYFRRGAFYDWRTVDLAELLDTCVRRDRPEWASDQYLRLAINCSEENAARVAAEARHQRLGTARNNMTYARDYLNAALELMERR